MGALDQWNYPNPQSTHEEITSSLHWSSQSDGSEIFYFNGVWMVINHELYGGDLLLRHSGDPVLSWTQSRFSNPDGSRRSEWASDMVYVNGRYEQIRVGYLGYPNSINAYFYYVFWATDIFGPWTLTPLPTNGNGWVIRQWAHLDGMWVGVGNDDGMQKPAPSYPKCTPCIIHGTLDGGWTVNETLENTGYLWGAYTQQGGPYRDYQYPEQIGFDGTTWYTFGRNVDYDGSGNDGPLARYSTSINGPWSTAVTTGLTNGQDFTGMKYDSVMGLWRGGATPMAYSSNPWTNGWSWTAALSHGMTGSLQQFVKAGGYWVFAGSDSSADIDYPRISYQAVNGTNLPTATPWTKVSVGGRSGIGFGNWTQTIATNENGRWVLANANWAEIRGNWSTTSGATDKILRAPSVGTPYPPTTWVQPTSGGYVSGGLGTISKAGDYWFCANASVLRYGATPVAWTQATMPDGPYFSNIYETTRVAFDGTTYAFATTSMVTTYDTAVTRVYYTTNPAGTWNVNVLGNVNGKTVYTTDINYADGQWVLVGGLVSADSLNGPRSHGFIATGTPDNWTFDESVSGTGLPDIGPIAGQYVQKITRIDFDGTYWGHAFNDNVGSTSSPHKPRFATSLSGPWTVANYNAGSNGVDGASSELKYHPQAGYWTAIDYSTTIDAAYGVSYAANPLQSATWTRMTYYDVQMVGSTGASSMAGNGDYWVCGGENSTVGRITYARSDGSPWGAYAIGTTSGQFGSSSYIRSVTYADGYFAFVNEYGQINYSRVELNMPSAENNNWMGYDPTMLQFPKPVIEASTPNVRSYFRGVGR
jgi:hypothetical protein